MSSVSKTIVCYGDSNTHGYNSANMGRFTEKERWTCLLADLLGPGYLVREEGLSGRTTSFDDPLFEGLNGFAFLHPCMMTHEPLDLLIIMLGTNDTKERFGVSPACIGLGLKRLIAKAKATECWSGGVPNILVVTPQNIGREYIDTACGATMGKGCAQKSEMLAEQFRLIADSMGCSYLDANKLVTAGPNQVDFMHLSEAGHGQLAAGLANYILGMF